MSGASGFRRLRRVAAAPPPTPPVQEPVPPTPPMQEQEPEPVPDPPAAFTPYTVEQYREARREAERLSDEVRAHDRAVKISESSLEARFALRDEQPWVDAMRLVRKRDRAMEHFRTALRKAKRIRRNLHKTRPSVNLAPLPRSPLYKAPVRPDKRPAKPDLRENRRTRGANAGTATPGNRKRKGGCWRPACSKRGCAGPASTNCPGVKAVVQSDPALARMVDNREFADDPQVVSAILRAGGYRRSRRGLALNRLLDDNGRAPSSLTADCVRHALARVSQRPRRETKRLCPLFECSRPRCQGKASCRKANPEAWKSHDAQRARDAEYRKRQRDKQEQEFVARRVRRIYNEMESPCVAAACAQALAADDDQW